MTTYTVVGLYDDNQQIWVEYAEGDNPYRAAIAACKKMIELNNGMDAENILVVSIFEGKHLDMNESTAVASVVDFPGWDGDEDED